MEPSRRKIRQRLLMSSSYVSPPPPRPDLPARFESLNDDTLGLILKFVGNKSYAIYAGISKHCKEIYLNTKEMTKETFLFGCGPLSVIKKKYKIMISEVAAEEDLELLLKQVGIGVIYHNRSDVFNWAIQEKNMFVLCGICDVAGEEGRVDVLNEVWEDIKDEDNKDTVFCAADIGASIRGKLKVLKWFEKKGVYIRKERCAEEAAFHGHLHILKWLQEFIGLELDGMLYLEAIDGNWTIGSGQLYVLKWLREQKVDWHEDTFLIAAEEGNLNILQWLHNEGCPWPNNTLNPVHEDEIEPEVLNWCRANGYGDRLS